MPASTVHDSAHSAVQPVAQGVRPALEEWHASRGNLASFCGADRAIEATACALHCDVVETATMSAPTPTTDKTLANDHKGVSILARSLFRNMSEQGYSQEQIIGLSTELIQLVHEDLRRASDDALAAQ